MHEFVLTLDDSRNIDVDKKINKNKHHETYYF